MAWRQIWDPDGGLARTLANGKPRLEMEQRITLKHGVVARVRCAPLAVLALLVLPTEAALVYAALEDYSGSWRIYAQDSLSSPPRQASGKGDGDASAPRLSPDGGSVAYEVPGAGLRICSLAPEPDCRTFNVEHGAAVRPFWDAAGHLLFVYYRAEADGEESDLSQISEGSNLSKPLLVQTGIQDYPDMSSDDRQLAYKYFNIIACKMQLLQLFDLKRF